MSETGGPGEEPTSAAASSHRAPPLPRSVADRVLAPLAAVAVVIIVIVLLIVINGHGSNGTSAAAVQSTTPSPNQTFGPATTSARPTKKPAAPTSSPTASRTPKPHKSSPTPSPTPAHSHSPAAKPTPVVAMAPVQVLNNSRITGLAHHVAAEVQAQGWTISFIGNLQGRVPETTVYFAPGDERAALHLAHEFSSIRRIEPNAEGGIHATNLTLVATSDWAQ